MTEIKQIKKGDRDCRFIQIHLHTSQIDVYYDVSTTYIEREQPLPLVKNITIKEYTFKDNELDISLRK